MIVSTDVENIVRLANTPSYLFGRMSASPLVQDWLTSRSVDDIVADLQRLLSQGELSGADAAQAYALLVALLLKGCFTKVKALAIPKDLLPWAEKLIQIGDASFIPTSLQRVTVHSPGLSDATNQTVPMLSAPSRESK
jgi:hypothetical protein